MSDIAYDKKSIAFHWSSAFLMVMLWGMGQYINNLAAAARVYDRSLHVVLGALLLLWMVYRLMWRIHVRQKRIEAMDWSDKLKSISHRLLYTLIFLTLIVGVMSVWYRGVNMFDLFRIPGFELENKFLRRLIVTVHAYLANGLMLVALCHACVALWHHFVIKDDVLLNMLGRKPPSQIDSVSH